MYKESFTEMLRKFGQDGGEGRGLLGRMSALEPYPPDQDIELTGKEDQYSMAKFKIEEIISSERQGNRNRVKVVSKKA